MATGLGKKRIVVGMMDGFGLDYYEKSDMDAEIAIAAESPPAQYIDRFGAPPDIYSRERT